MKKIIHFCNKTAGSNWWLIATIASIALPSCAILYTFHQFIGMHPELMGRILIGCDYSLIKFIWIDTGLRCGNPPFGSDIAESAPIIIDILLIYVMFSSETFFQIWKGNIFMSDPSVEFCGWNIPIMRFNSEKEVRFFRLPLGQKGYWFQPIGNSKRYEPVRRFKCK